MFFAILAFFGFSGEWNLKVLIFVVVLWEKCTLGIKFEVNDGNIYGQLVIFWTAQIRLLNIYESQYNTDNKKNRAYTTNKFFIYLSIEKLNNNLFQGYKSLNLSYYTYIHITYKPKYLNNKKFLIFSYIHTYFLYYDDNKQSFLQKKKKNK